MGTLAFGVNKNHLFHTKSSLKATGTVRNAGIRNCPLMKLEVIMKKCPEYFEHACDGEINHCIQLLYAFSGWNCKKIFKSCKETCLCSRAKHHTAVQPIYGWYGRDGQNVI
ncbi:hypothetical protein T10_226 [Trichinella papuae]|uniref:Uncharacterized protein n=1 Tax=Trichinella papuae TaxID=268474 RepID=A0A0V1N2L4_9BILA|nr:hypothetical protein T10_226 [Trichinella papuae]